MKFKKKINKIIKMIVLKKKTLLQALLKIRKVGKRENYNHSVKQIRSYIKKKLFKLNLKQVIHNNKLHITIFKSIEDVLAQIFQIEFGQSRQKNKNQKFKGDNLSKKLPGAKKFFSNTEPNRTRHFTMINKNKVQLISIQILISKIIANYRAVKRK